LYGVIIAHKGIFVTDMTEQELEKLRFPIGPFVEPKEINLEDIDRYIDDLEMLPAKLREVSIQIHEKGLMDTPYRPDGWTARQVIHHVADSHMNAYIRMKLALTEDEPTIKPYMEQRWAELEDTKQVDPIISIDLLTALHIRWVRIMRTLNMQELATTFYHPEKKQVFRMDEVLALYRWHGYHHLGHLEIILSKNKI
jgi:hypothetical protein